MRRWCWWWLSLLVPHSRITVASLRCLSSSMASLNKVTLAVGSKNPVKINAAVLGAKKALKLDDIVVSGFDVPSGVSAQPMSDDETLQGAINRAKSAFDAYSKEHNTPPTFALGLEVYNGNVLGRARTGSFQLPPAIRRLVVERGMELGAADDHLFGTINSKQGGGSVGQFTKGVIDRTHYYEHAVILAFVPFLWENLFSDSVEV